MYANYFDQLLEANTDILQTISHKHDRKYIFGAICKVATHKYSFKYDSYFQNKVELLGNILNLLLINTVERLQLKNITMHLQEVEEK